MKFKIVSDSSSDLHSLNSVPFSSVPLKIITDEKEYVDIDSLNVDSMIDDLKKYKGESKSSCPNASEWLDAFEDYENIFCVAITRNLSGSYNAARIAAEEYIEKYPNRNVFIVDTLSVGPESALIIEKIVSLIENGLEFDEIKEKITEYQKSTHLLCHTLTQRGGNGPVGHDGKMGTVLLNGSHGDDGQLRVQSHDLIGCFTVHKLPPYCFISPPPFRSGGCGRRA